MKKKIINGLLMMALAVSTTSSFVSCTDTNADDIAQIREQMADQSTIEGLKGQVAELMGLVQRLADVKIGDKNLIDDQKYLEELFKQLQELGVAANQGQSGNVGPQLPDGNQAQNLNDWVKKVTEMIKTIQSTVSGLQTQIAGIKSCECEAHGGSGCTCDLSGYTPIGDFNTLNTAFNNFINTYDPSAFASSTEFLALKQAFEKIDTTKYATKAELSELITTTDSLKDAFNKIDWKKYATADNLSALTARHDSLLAAFNKIDTTKYATKEELTNAMTEISNIQTSLTTIQQTQITQGTKLQELTDSINKAYERAKRDSMRIDALEAASASHASYATKQELKDSVDSLRKEILAVKQAAKEYTDQWIEALKTELTTKITDLETATNLKFGEMQNLINGLDERITKAETDVKDLSEKQAALQKQVDELTKKVEENSKKIESIFSAMKKQVTGIIVQGAYSPVFGIGMLPVDAKTNILAAYYGYATKEVEFPAKKDAKNYVDQDEFWQMGEEGEGQFIMDIEPYTASRNQLLLSDAEDNAGKLYLTVNPAQVDFTDKEIVLENSQGTAAPIKLSRLRKSNYKLSFGWTRSAQNGFYEAKAKISAENLEAAKARIDVATLKEAAKDLYNKHNTASLKEAAKAIISQNGDILDAQAVKAEYESVDEKGIDEKKNVLSDYSIATTVIRPLSYNTLRGWNPTSIPGINKVESTISKFIDKVNIKVNLGFNKKIEVPTTIKEIKIVDLDETLKAKFKMTFEVKVDSFISVDDPEHGKTPITASIPVDIQVDQQTGHGTVMVNGTPTDVDVIIPGYKITDNITAQLDPFKLTIIKEFTVDFTNEIQQLYDGLQQPMKDVNTMLRDLQTFMDDIQPMLDNISNMDAKINGQIEDAKNSIKNELISYIDRFEKKVLSYASYVNQALQPVLLYKSVNGLKRVSTIEKGASKMSGTVLLVPTSFNAELLSPAFKKLVVCTGAWKADGTFDANEAKRVNGAGFENFGKVFEGQERVASFEGKAGYKYRIVYQALDYHGMIASSRYYVQY